MNFAVPTKYVLIQTHIYDLSRVFFSLITTRINSGLMFSPTAYLFCLSEALSSLVSSAAPHLKSVIFLSLSYCHILSIHAIGLYRDVWIAAIA